MQKIYLTYLTFLFGACTLLNSQNTSLEGHVRDKEKNRPLPGAHVYLEGTNAGAASNNKGAFKLGNVKPGTYDLVVSFSGFRRIKKTVELDEGAHSFDLEPFD